mmetsp:Transcript_20527/g.44448  ORF Transcript_20527/g.44448 Transcript_20527/m.44448 type:complete len:170 (+) Transcript_20527:131-640(+)|eukprot:CAMPEP_0168739226 /NCGR_PEP_ID=MMETSP0724-20121128/11344_1 /TAXON_ID=265536 /ORGANISM="Amphiprora sp., Strain CCMP467" /LENGTH=169 /DNA_ID=CAMNT_0008786603 /DNA_START=43 /DNA_END=552 /DNA_ORIENTATION=-
MEFMQQLLAQHCCEDSSNVTLVSDNCLGHSAQHQQQHQEKKRRRRRKPRKMSTSFYFNGHTEEMVALPENTMNERLAIARWGDDEETTDSDTSTILERQATQLVDGFNRWKTQPEDSSTSTTSSLDSMVSLKSLVIAQGRQQQLGHQRRLSHDGSLPLVLPQRKPDQDD